MHTSHSVTLTDLDTGACIDSHILKHTNEGEGVTKVSPMVTQMWSPSLPLVIPTW